MPDGQFKGKRVIDLPDWYLKSLRDVQAHRAAEFRETAARELREREDHRHAIKKWRR